MGNTAQMNDLFVRWCGKKPEQIIPLTPSGSNRSYFRLIAGEISAIACVGENVKENTAFLEMSALFKAQGHPVPEIYAVNDSRMIYLQEDLGGESLFDRIKAQAPVDQLIRQTLQALARLQVQAGRSVDWTWCYPQEALDERTVRWDLNYFKYAFLKPSGTTFDEVKLQDAFDAIEADVLSSNGDYFLYRDFQSRNVMVRDDKIYFIDYQGGRRGNVLYDVASFLFQARSGFSVEQQLTYLSVYREALLHELSPQQKQEPWVEESAFLKQFYLNAFLRLLQVMGAYGYRGWFERKSHFIQSIPPVLESMRALLQQAPILEAVPPYLCLILQNLTETLSASLPPVQEPAQPSVLEIQVTSFSFHKGIPEDYSGNGGGFVFDCRGMHNPGRYAEYKSLTGLDKPVMEFLEDRGEIQGFLEHVRAVIEPTIQTYLKRGFSHLMISFGCTGGQHRSVYAAQKTAEYLAKIYPQANVCLNHREQARKSVWKKGKLQTPERI